MRLAIMQPYYLPYIGYWQLMHSVDRFVLYDDVQFIQRGWVNRNRILVNGHEVLLTLPLRTASRGDPIHTREISDEPHGRPRLLQTIGQAYRRYPGYADVMPTLERLLADPAPGLADYLARLITGLAELMEVRCEIVRSSQRHAMTQTLTGQDRILEICRLEGADSYINPPGGVNLYQDEAFSSVGCELRFLAPRPVPYAQRSVSGFVPWLSVVDVLMSNGVAGTRAMLGSYDLLTQSELVSALPAEDSEPTISPH